VTKQWEEKIAAVEAEANAAMTGGAPKSYAGRSAWVKNVFAAKTWYTFRFQLPPARERKRVLTLFQRMVDGLGIGRSRFVSAAAAKRDKEEGGLKHLDVEGHLKGEWAMMVRAMATRAGRLRAATLSCSVSASKPLNGWGFVAVEGGDGLSDEAAVPVYQASIE